jgi:hypothetical protein
METVVADPESLRGLLAVYHKIDDNLVNDQRFWTIANLIFQGASLVLGIIATLMMALQSELNRSWVKPVGIIATTLSTGLVTAYSTFHVRENIDKLISIQAEELQYANALEMYIRRNPDKTMDLDQFEKYTDLLNKLGEQKRRLMGSIGNINEQFRAPERGSGGK